MSSGLFERRLAKIDRYARSPVAVIRADAREREAAALDLRPSSGDRSPPADQAGAAAGSAQMQEQPQMQEQQTREAPGDEPAAEPPAAP